MTLNIEMVYLICPVCGIPVLLPEGARNPQRKTWFCPNGHATCEGCKDMRDYDEADRRADTLERGNKELIGTISALRGVITKLQERRK